MSEETGDNRQSGSGPGFRRGCMIFLLSWLAIVICCWVWDFYRRFDNRIQRLERRVEELERRR